MQGANACCPMTVTGTMHPLFRICSAAAGLKSVMDPTDMLSFAFNQAQINCMA
jgi:hypothetical protein